MQSHSSLSTAISLQTEISYTEKSQPAVLYENSWEESVNLSFYITKPKKTTILNRIRNRKHKQGLKIDVKLAEKVLKEFILPMLMIDNQHTKRIESAKSHGYRLPPKPSKSKLSDILKKQVRLAKLAKKDLLDKFSSTNVDIQKYQAEIEVIRNKITNKQALLKLLQKDTQKIDGKIGGLFRSKIKIQEKSRDQLANELEDQIKLNQTLKYMAIHSEYLYWEYQMSNVILGEHLKSLAFACTDLRKRSNLNFWGLSDELEDESNQNVDNLSHINSNNHEMVKKIFEISSHKQGIYKSIHDIKNNVRSYIHNINQSIKTSQEEIENCSVKILNFDLKMRSLKKEFTNLSAKVRKAIPKFHFYRDTEEKLCNVCSEIYSEKRNFNWSCCGHPSEYGTGMYWCCGQTNIRAAGCKKMKHVCDVDQDLNLEEYKRVIIVCTSCKEAGHTSHSCPKDPNYINFELKVTKIAKISQFTSPRNSIISSGDLIRKSLDLPKAHIYKRKHKQSFEDINNIQESIRVNGFYVTEKLPIISERRFN